MKRSLFLLAILALTLASCTVNSIDNKSTDYTTETVKQLNAMKSPVILIGKDMSFGCYSVTVRDGNGNIQCFGNISTLANCIGESNQVGDTIK